MSSHCSSASTKSPHYPVSSLQDPMPANSALSAYSNANSPPPTGKRDQLAKLGQTLFQTAKFTFKGYTNLKKQEKAEKKAALEKMLQGDKLLDDAMEKTIHTMTVDCDEYNKSLADILDKERDAASRFTEATEARLRAYDDYFQHQSELLKDNRPGEPLPLSPHQSGATSRISQKLIQRARPWEEDRGYSSGSSDSRADRGTGAVSLGRQVSSHYCIGEEQVGNKHKEYSNQGGSTNNRDKRTATVNPTWYY